MLRNKKGLEYAAVMVMVILIVNTYLFVKLYDISNERTPVSIGEHQVGMMNAFSKGEDALLFVDQSAKFSAYRSMYTLALNGGSLDLPCGTVGDLTAWSMAGKDCVALINQYKTFQKVFNNNMNAYLGSFEGVQWPVDSYEIFAEKDKLTGTAVNPAIINIDPPDSIKEVTILFGQITIERVPIKKGIIGEYAFRPSFTVPVATGLEKYDELKKNVNDLTTCITEDQPQDACIDRLRSKVKSVERINSDYIKVTADNSAKSPYQELPDISFAVYLPEPTPIAATG